MKHDIQLRPVTDVNSRQDFNWSNILGITFDFLCVNRQLIPVSCEYRSVLQLQRSDEQFND